MKFSKRICLLIIIIGIITSIKLQKGPTENSSINKFLFMYKYPEVKGDVNHKLNNFSYKTLVLSDELAVFESLNNSMEVKSI